MRLLIIDDSALIRRILGNALLDAGLSLDEVIEAGDGAQGIAVLEGLAAKGQALGLIICDVHMPILNGVGFLCRRAELGLTTAPVLIVTADASDPLVTEALAAGARGFVTKPFSAQQLRDRVGAITGDA